MRDLQGRSSATVKNPLALKSRLETGEDPIVLSTGPTRGSAAYWTSYTEAFTEVLPIAAGTEGIIS